MSVTFTELNHAMNAGLRAIGTMSRPPHLLSGEQVSGLIADLRQVHSAEAKLGPSQLTDSHAFLGAIERLETGQQSAFTSVRAGALQGVGHISGRMSAAWNHLPD